MLVLAAIVVPTNVEQLGDLADMRLFVVLSWMETILCWKDPASSVSW